MSNFDSVLAGHPHAGTAVSGFSDSSNATHQQLSAGTLLREAREAAGLHIATLAVSLKVPAKKLEALEQDRFDLLPDLVFVRALASSVCRTLKLDPALVLERLPQTAAPKLTAKSSGINTPFRSPGDGPGPSMLAQVSRPAVLAVLALLMGALVLIFLPVIKPPSESVAVVGASTAESAKSAVLPGPSGEAVTVASVAPAEGLTSSAESLTSIALSPLPLPAQAAVPVSAPTTAPAATVANSTVALSATATAANPVVQAVPASIVTFSTKGESWVEVTDAKGAVVLRRTLAAGEVAGASGVLPLRAVVGRADATQVQVRGQALDLTAQTRDNVARFEVK
jgi:cytoskeleton protein RodZ